MLSRLFACAVCLCLGGYAAAAEFGKDVDRVGISLNGSWDILREHGDEELWKPGAAEKAGKWEPVQVPGNLVVENARAGQEMAHFVWARKTFTLDAAQAAKNAVLRWGGIRFGATAWLNGTKICEHTAVGPNSALIPAGVTKTGENVLLLKIPGWNGVAKGKSGFPLMPVGAATQSWGDKGPAIYYDVWMEFYTGVYAKHVLAIPNLKDGTVTFRVWIDSLGDRPANMVVWAQVCPYMSQMSVGAAQVKAEKGKSPVDLTLKLHTFKPWTLENRQLYWAQVRLMADGKTYDDVSFIFGMREIKIENGHYTLNGAPFWFRGSDLVNEWHWGEVFNENVKRYVVDEARAMNLNSFRTHTCPPPHSWLNVCDEYGTFILAEFPILYNGSNFRFTKEEYEIFHANALKDAEGWVTELWNHPSVAVWVLSNESSSDTAWEQGPLQDLVNALDPTRTTMRTDSRRGTRDTADVHTCNNIAGDSEGLWIERFRQYAAEKDPKRVLTNTEYMNVFGDSSKKWVGYGSKEDYEFAYAECAAEHTEEMRRLNYDGLFPYMYAGWTGLRTGAKWQPEYPTMMAASLHSSMAPVLASLDLYDRNFVAGETRSTRVALINELPRDVDTTVRLYLSTQNPMLVPQVKALGAPVMSQELKLKASSMTSTTITWKVPEKEGNYWLSLITTRDGDRPVVSQRVVRAVAPSPKEKALKGKRVVLLGGSGVMEKWLRDRGVVVWTQIPEGGIVADAVIIADSEAKGITEKGQPAEVLDYAKAGGRVILLDVPNWTWKNVVDFTVFQSRSSRAFAYPDAAGHWLLDGIDPECLKRWNGTPNAVSSRILKSVSTPGAKNILWVDDPSKPVVASVAAGKGEILICMLKIEQRISAASKDRDPVAERMLVNMVVK